MKLRGRGNASYTCDNGCCEIRVLVHPKRGYAAQVWINGELGTFESHGKAMGVSSEAVNSKIRRRGCMNVRAPTRDVRVTEKASQALAARFLVLPRVSV
jgi:hypothetical protein